jgi:hypothetical protein
VATPFGLGSGQREAYGPSKTMDNVDLLAWFEPDETSQCPACDAAACITLEPTTAVICFACGAVWAPDGRRIDLAGQPLGRRVGLIASERVKAALPWPQLKRRVQRRTKATKRGEASAEH